MSGKLCRDTCAKSGPGPRSIIIVGRIALLTNWGWIAWKAFANNDEFKYGGMWVEQQHSYFHERFVWQRDDGSCSETLLRRRRNGGRSFSNATEVGLWEHRCYSLGTRSSRRWGGCRLSREVVFVVIVVIVIR